MKSKKLKKNKTKKTSLLIRLFLFFFVLGVVTFLSLFIYYSKDLPRPEKFTERPFPESTKIYDRTGTVLLYDIYGEEKRTYVKLDQMPDYLQKAVIAAEDKNFYTHFGIDLEGIARSFLINLKIRKLSVGGSTLNQQLIRSSFLNIQKTAQRKIREIILSLELDRKYEKDQILEWYLNQVPFGSNAYGIEAASQTYFRKPASKLSLSESTILAAIVQAPTRFSPYTNKEGLLERQKYVLNRMVSDGYITESDMEVALQEEIIFQKPTTVRAPYFTLQYIKGYLDSKYSPEFLREKGLKVYTSLDWDIQQIAEQAVIEGAKQNKNNNAYNAALVSIDPKTGEILAMVGGVDYFADPYPAKCIPGKNCKLDPQFNVATLGLRQPGSAFKPFAYITAFNKGATPDTIVVDEETNFGIWGGKEYIPKNYDDHFRGAITLRSSLAQSINVTSIKVLLDLAGPDIESSVKSAEDMGITTLNPPYGPSIVLGGWEVKLLDITSAYGVFATEGLRVPPVTILKIEDAQGNIIEENKKTQKRVLPIESCRMMNDVLSDNNARAPMFGYYSSLYFPGYQLAAKTGTTQNYQDAWVVGYTPFMSTGVWVGNNDNSPMKEKPSVVLAGPIFHNFMAKMLIKYPVQNFVPSEKIIIPVSQP
ncbi:MAG: PBP1A family penicillin-binding protein [Patescibacteria group bacterium]